MTRYILGAPLALLFLAIVGAGALFAGIAIAAAPRR